MQCPHLIINEQGKTCKRMLEEGLEGAVADFDIEHYCRGNPTCCYYFRASAQLSKRDEKGAKNRANNHFTTVSQSV